MVNKIVIKKGNTLTEVTPNRGKPLRFVFQQAAAGGTTFVCKSNAVSNTITLSLNKTWVDIASDFQKNYEDIITQSSTAFQTAAGPAGYYVARINGILSDYGTVTRVDRESEIKPSQNTFTIIGGLTTDVKPIANTNTITIDDFGLPDLDCADYATLNVYLRRLKEFFEKAKAQILNGPVEGPNDTAKIYGLHRQYSGLIDIWNNLVHLTAVRANASYQNKNIFVQISIVNNSDAVASEKISGSLYFLDTSELGMLYAAPVTAYAMSGRRGDNTFNIKGFIPETEVETYKELTEFKPYFELDTGTQGIQPLDTVTLQFQIAVRATAEAQNTGGGKKVIYDIEKENGVYKITPVRTMVIPGLPVSGARNSTTFEYRYTNGMSGTTSRKSDGTITIAPVNTEFSEDDVGTYYVEMQANGNYSVYKTGGLPFYGVNVEPRGAFNTGDKFVFNIVPIVTDTSNNNNTNEPTITGRNIVVGINLNNVPLSKEFTGSITKEKPVHISDEGRAIGKIEYNVVATTKVDAPDIEQSQVLQEPIEIGSIAVGSVFMGDVKPPLVFISTVVPPKVSPPEVNPPNVVVEQVNVAPLNVKYNSVSVQINADAKLVD